MGEAFDYIVNDCGMEGGDFVKMLLSGILSVVFLP